MYAEAMNVEGILSRRMKGGGKEDRGLWGGEGELIKADLYTCMKMALCNPLQYNNFFFIKSQVFCLGP